MEEEICEYCYHLISDNACSNCKSICNACADKLLEEVNIIAIDRKDKDVVEIHYKLPKKNGGKNE